MQSEEQWSTSGSNYTSAQRAMVYFRLQLRLRKILPRRYQEPTGRPRKEKGSIGRSLLSNPGLHEKTKEQKASKGSKAWSIQLAQACPGTREDGPALVGGRTGGGVQEAATTNKGVWTTTAIPTVSGIDTTSRKKREPSNFLHSTQVQRPGPRDIP
jgi:hypothetical protein